VRMLSARLHVVITDAGTASQLAVEGASSLDGPWQEIVEFDSTAGNVGEYFVDLDCDDGAQYKLYRYLRWCAGSSTSGDTICFWMELETD